METLFFKLLCRTPDCFDIMKIYCWNAITVNDCEHQRLDQLCRAFCAFVARAIIALSSNRQFPQIFQSSGKSSAMWEEEGWQV